MSRFMPRLTKSLNAWGSDSFSPVLKEELQSLQPGTLPLHCGTTRGGLADDTAVTATVLSASDAAGALQVKVGIFFTEIVAGCSCGDDPAAYNAYCEILVRIDTQTAACTFELLAQ
jgi:hypothetical protein